MYRIKVAFKKIRFLSVLLYSKREKVIGVLLEVIRNPRASKTAQLITQSIRLVKENLLFLKF